MNETLNEFFELIKKNYPKNYDKIVSAYKFAESAHKGVFRKSGEPYIIHPLAVAKILVENNMDYSSIMAGLLHDVVEDTSISLDDIKKKFGETVAKLVDGVTKIDNFTAKQKNLTEADSIKRLLVAMGNDIRVIFIKLADRLHNMRTIAFLSREKQIKMAKETKELFIPIAERFGIRKIRSELEELTTCCLYPEEIQKIKAEFDAKLGKRKEQIEEIEKNLKQKLQENDINSKVMGWPEHYYSIFKKIKIAGIGKVYGLMLFKVIVPTEQDCYRALGIFHKEYEHLPGQIKDFISSPKPNGYRSIHSVLITKDGKVTFKVMIRTPKMDKVCEYGISSFWYKKDSDVDFGEAFEKFNKLKAIIGIESMLATSSNSFIDLIKKDLYTNFTWVFTPKYRPIRIECERPTAIDFAYKVHTKIGDNAVSAIVNGKPVSLGTELNSGDVVNIITSKTDKAPSRNWLFVCKTSFARRRIREYFTRHTTQKNVLLGRKMLETELLNKNHTIADLEAVFDEINKEFSFSSMHDLFASVGYGAVTIQQIISYITAKEEAKKTMENSPVEIEGISECLKITFPRCCYPLPGDKILAVMSKGGFAIHCVDCSKIISVPSTKLFKAKWKDKINERFDTAFKVVATDSVGFGSKLFGLLSGENYNLTRAEAKIINHNDCEFVLGLSVKNRANLEEIMQKISKLEGVKHVSRVSE